MHPSQSTIGFDENTLKTTDVYALSGVMGSATVIYQYGNIWQGETP